MEAPNLSNLPEEILLHILTYLDSRDVAKLQLVSRAFRDLCRDNGFWRLRCLDESAFVLQHTKRVALEHDASRDLDRTRLPADIESCSRDVARSRRRRSPAGPRSRKDRTLKRLYANWDFSYPSESVSWYDEYVHRNAPAQINWFQEARVREGDATDYIEARGLTTYRPTDGELLAVAPLDDGSVCLWDIKGTRARKGAILARSDPGILLPDRPAVGKSPRSDRIDTAVTEFVSVDHQQNRAFFAVRNRLIEMDLQRLAVVGCEAYPWSVTALSPATPGLPLTVGTILGIHMHDYRAPSRHWDDALDRVDSWDSFSSKDGYYQRSSKERPSRDEPSHPFASLAQPGPLSILHMPRPGTENVLSQDIYVAGRFSNILHYDRRKFPSIMDSIYSGASLCSLTSLPFSVSPLDSELRRRGELSTEQLDRAASGTQGNTLIAGGEYNSKGSLEMYGLSPSSAQSPSQPGRVQNSAFKNRQTSSQSKLLSVVNHGTLLAFSDGSGLLKWFERDGFTEARRLKLEHKETAGVRSLFASMPAAGELARKLVPTGPSQHECNSNDLLFWTGERIGLVSFQSSPGIAAADFEEMARTAEEAERENAERDYADRMRRALERQADDVRFVRHLGLGSGVGIGG